ncbi:MAG: hypothetical protein ACI4IS_01595 [Acutalibacteraceae bacterium]
MRFLKILLSFLLIFSLLPFAVANAQGEKSENKAVCSVELFTIGGGFLVYPTKIDVSQEKTAAEYVTELLHSNGYCAYYGGDFDDSFYLAYIGSGTRASKYNGYANSTSVLGECKNAKQLKINSQIPDCIKSNLVGMRYFTENDEQNYNGFIGEFMFTNGSGFLYCVNNEFSSKSLSQTTLKNGDVLRVQFTLSNGADIGGLDKSMGNSLSSFYPVANKDSLLSLLADATDKSITENPIYTNALAVMQTVNSTQKQVDTAHFQLYRLLTAQDSTNKTDSTTPVKNNDNGNSVEPQTNPETKPYLSENSEKTDNTAETVTQPTTEQKTQETTVVHSETPSTSALTTQAETGAQMELDVLVATDDNTPFKPLYPDEKEVTAEQIFLYSVIVICIIAVIIYFILRNKIKDKLRKENSK